MNDTESPEEAALIARLARCAADLYQRVPREGAGLVVQAAEIAHASDLELLAASLDVGADAELDEVLHPADIRAVCRLLLDVRRNPATLSPDEVTVAREHYPEVEAESLDPLEQILGFYTGLLHGR